MNFCLPILYLSAVWLTSKADDPIIIVVTKDPNEFKEEDIPPPELTSTVTNNVSPNLTETVAVFYPTTTLSTTSKYLTVSDVDKTASVWKPSIKPTNPSPTISDTDAGGDKDQVPSVKPVTELPSTRSTGHDVKPTVSDSEDGVNDAHPTVKPITSTRQPLEQVTANGRENTISEAVTAKTAPTISDSAVKPDTGQLPSVKPVVSISTTELPSSQSSGDDVKPTISDSEDKANDGHPTVKPITTTEQPLEKVTENGKEITGKTTTDSARKSSNKPTDSSPSTSDSNAVTDAGQVPSVKPVTPDSTTELPTSLRGDDDVRPVVTDATANLPSTSSETDIHTSSTRDSKEFEQKTEKSEENGKTTSPSDSMESTINDVVNAKTTAFASTLTETVTKSKDTTTEITDSKNTEPSSTASTLVTPLTNQDDSTTETESRITTTSTTNENDVPADGAGLSSSSAVPSSSGGASAEPTTTFLPLTTFLSTNKTSLPPWCWRDEYGRVICKKKCGTKKPKKKGKNSSSSDSEESYKVWKPKKPCKEKGRKGRKKEEARRKGVVVVAHHRKCHILIVLTKHEA